MNIDLKRAETDALYLTKVVDYLVININHIDDMADVFAIDEIVSSLEKEYRRNKKKMRDVMLVTS